MSDTKTSPRAILARAPVAAAATLAAGTAVNSIAVGIATATEADPAIAVVEEWYAADQDYRDVLNSDEGSEGPRTNAAFKAQDRAMAALFNVTPTTIAGAVTLLEAIASYDGEAPRGMSPLEWWAADHGDMGQAVNDTLLEIVEALRNGGRP